MVLEQTDGIEPNKWPPPATKKMGAAKSVFSELHATSGNITTLDFTNAVVGGTSRTLVARYNQVGDVPGSVVGLEITHNLNNSGCMVDVYANGTVGGRHQEGSGTNAAVVGEYLVEASGLNSLYIYSAVALTSVNVVVHG